MDSWASAVCSVKYDLHPVGIQFCENNNNNNTTVHNWHRKLSEPGLLVQCPVCSRNSAGTYIVFSTMCKLHPRGVCEAVRSLRGFPGSEIWAHLLQYHPGPLSSLASSVHDPPPSSSLSLFKSYSLYIREIGPSPVIWVVNICPMRIHFRCFWL